MHCVLVVTIMAVLLVNGVTDAAAAQWVTQTACDSVVIQGVTYPRVTFEIRDQDPHRDADLIVALRLPSSGPEDTCRAVGATGPQGWVTAVSPVDGFVIWQRASEDAPMLLPGQSLGGFQMALTPGHSSCFEFQFVGIFPEPLALENNCFECDLPVPVTGRTWGALKALYR